MEAEFLFHAGKLRQFQEDYRMMPIDIPGTNYLEIKVRANETMDIVREVRMSAESRESRDKYYEKILPYCDQLAGDIRLLDAAREELNKKWKNRPQTEEGTRRRWTITTAVAVCALIAGSIGTTIFKSWFERRADAVPLIVQQSSASSSAPSRTLPQSRP